MSGWIGVDLDATLAEYNGLVNITTIGRPIPLMIDRVKLWLKQGRDVRIFTARVDGGLDKLTGKPVLIKEVVEAIEVWCLEHIGHKLPVTNKKDFGMIELWDDRAIQIIPNTGVRADGRD